MHIISTYPQEAHKNPDVCGHKHQISLYGDIELHIQVVSLCGHRTTYIQGLNCSETMGNPDV